MTGHDRIGQRTSRWLVGLLLALTLLGAAGWLLRPSSPAPQPAVEGPTEQGRQADGPPLFRDVTADSGVDCTYHNGEEADLYTILESLGGGVALLDYDGDGRLDLFFPGGGRFAAGRIAGRPGRLYHNLGGWRFRDVTAETGLTAAPFYSHGALVLDWDNDGWPDLLITGYGGMALYHNVAADQGGRRFVDVTRRAGLIDDRWCTSAALADLSGSGRADLYVCRYVEWSLAADPRCPSKAPGRDRDVCPPQRFAAAPHSLYRRDAGGTYRDVATEAGLRVEGKGLGVVATDLNADGLPDLYIANDATNNLLYLNRAGGRLQEKGLDAGVATDVHGQYNGSMGVAVGDYDGSGRASLFVTNFQGENHALYQNLGNERFLYASQSAGIAALGQEYVGFGTAFLDFDNDGWLDLALVNGHVLRHPVGTTFRQRPLLLHNGERRGRRFFSDVSRRGGPYFATPALGRGLAVGDLDNDGWPDLVVSHSNTPAALLRNEGAGAGTHWLGVQLVGRNHRPVVGATVTLEVGARQLTRFVRSGGYLCSDDPRLRFGLGSASGVGRLRVRWPRGTTQTFDALAIDRYWTLVEGEAAARPVGAIHP